MKAKLKTLVAAVALSTIAGGANAAIYLDNYETGIAKGNGSGELWFSLWDPGRALSLIMDMNLSVNEFRNNNAALIGSFKVQDDGLKNFIAGGNKADMVWSMGGLSNGDPRVVGDTRFGIVATHGGARFGAGDTISTGPEGEAPRGFSPLKFGMDNAKSYVSGNNFDLGENGTVNVIADSDARGYVGGGWGGTYGGSLNFDAGGTLEEKMYMSYMYVDGGSDFRSKDLSVERVDAYWKLDADLGEVSLVPVPVPPALWLLGSALAGIVAVARRRKQESEGVLA